MNYIYDILINLQKEIYDFYEWELGDTITHIRKVPLLKVSSDALVDIKKHKIRLGEDALKQILNKTEIFTGHSVRILKYVCLFADDKDVIAIEFDKNGVKSRISKLLVDEEVDVLEVCEHIGDSPILYNIIKYKEKENFKTRKELRIYDYILKQLKKDNYEKLKYLYFECFDQHENDYDKIIREIKEALDNDWEFIYEKIYNFFKLSSQK
ncbi:MAG: hypothetical protein E7173_01755 [Firmicutes bacterium]|nr:hypothetical protein [Bacillota bacterium]